MVQRQLLGEVGERAELAMFQVTTDLNSERPEWISLSFLPNHIFLPELMQYIPLHSVNQIWVSKALAQQLTWVNYTDPRGKEQTLVFKVRDGSGKAAGEQFKSMYRRLVSAKPKPEPVIIKNNQGWMRFLLH